jgi:hypothetical protein
MPRPITARSAAQYAERIAPSIRRILFAEITAGDLDTAIISQLPAAQLALDDKLKPGPLEMQRLQASFGRRRLIEQPLERPGDPDGALVWAQE